MKAAIYEKKSKCFVLKEAPIPALGKNDVLVKIERAAVNAADCRMLKMGLLPKSRIFGADVAGVVEQVGSEVKTLRAGDRVLGDISGVGFGGFAQYAGVPETVLAKLPDGVTYDSAAAVPLSGVTALQGLRRAGVHAGQKVLIVGAGGGVGIFAVQLANHLGAQVTAVCSAQNAKIISSLGVQDVIDYNKQDYTKIQERFDVLLVVNGYQSPADYKRLLKKRGVCVIIGGAMSQLIKAMIFGWLIFAGSKKLYILAAKPCEKDTAHVIKLVNDGVVNPIIDRHYPLEKTGDAISYMMQGHAHGKVIIDI